MYIIHRSTQVQVKVLNAENKALRKDLRHKNKKLRRKRRGSTGGSFLWLLDRMFFGGRIFFVTKELPRDVNAIRKLHVDMEDNQQEITRCKRLAIFKESPEAQFSVLILSIQAWNYTAIKAIIYEAINEPWSMNCIAYKMSV